MQQETPQNGPDTRLRASSPEVSAWVSANAGAGKTQLLVSRVLRLLLAGTEPSRILCVTYTRAAAAEMRERILSSLSKWVRLSGAELEGELGGLCGQPPSRETLARARALFAMLADAPEGLRIDTLHAFCQSLLKRFPLEAGMAPYFTVIDERTSQELLHEAAMRMFTHSMGGDAALREAVQQLAARMSETRFHDVLQGIARERHRLRGVLLGGVEAAVRRAYALLGVGFSDTEASLIARWLPELEQSGKTLDEYLAFYLTKKGELRVRGFPKDEAALAAQERAHAFEMRRRALGTAKKSACLLTVAAAMMEEYDALKRARAVADYDDLVDTALRMLASPGIAPWVMFKLDGGIDHVLIDEAQDTSRAQWDIARALTEEFFAGEGKSEAVRTLFAVGDVKQSIFRFQGARPELFAEMREYYARRVPEAREEWASVTLPESFRSVKPVLGAVDAVFARPEANLGLAAEVRHLLTEKRQGHGGRVEVWPLLAGAAAAKEWQMPRAYKRQENPELELAQKIAETIRGWVGVEPRSGSGAVAHEHLLESKGRPIAPGDIMILVRRRDALAGALLHALRKAGVPVAGADRLTLSDSLAVQDLLALGAFLLLPEDDLTLAALLKSPLFALGEDELFALAHGRQKRPLWERLQEMRAQNAVFARAHAMLSELLAMADFRPPYELFAHVLDTLDGRARFTARMGHAVEDVLDEFLAQALAYERAHTPSLQGFVQWMAMADTQIRRDMEQGQGEVRIMTVHAAKGLQAPIVILPDTAALKAPHNPLLWHDDVLLWSPSEAEASTEAQALKDVRAAEELHEYRRLLYVAMTRAEDRLYVCGVQKKGAKGGWHALVWEALSGIAAEVDTPAGKGLRLSCPQEKDAGNAPFAVAPACAPMPEALLRAALPEVASRTLSPSALWEDDVPAFSPVGQEKLFQRGVLIHRLLQYLPAAPPEMREAAARNMLARHGVAAGEQAALAGEVLTLLAAPEFSAFFGEYSLAEVPLAGMVYIKGKAVPVAGQVDRLAVTADAVWVLDYKTHAAPPANAASVPLRYLRQMAAYRALLTGIYPERRIRCALLWTAGPTLMELGEEKLAGMA